MPRGCGEWRETRKGTKKIDQKRNEKRNKKRNEKRPERHRDIDFPTAYRNQQSS
jgi:hypothetical protein